MVEFLIVGLGGFIGSCLRFGVSKLLSVANLDFPLSTLIVNVLAGFIVGFITGLEAQAGALSPRRKLFLTTGMMGGLSTFSTFSIETVNLFSQGKYLYSVGNVALNLSLSLIGVVLGMALAKLIIKK